MGEHHSWSLPGLGPYITPQTDSPSPLPWMALIIARTSLGLDGSVSCLWRWDCRCLRGMTLLVVADLYLPSSEPPELKQVSLVHPGHLHLKPVDIPVDVFEATSPEASLTGLCRPSVP